MLGVLLCIKISDKQQIIKSNIQNEVASKLTSMLADQPLRFIANQGQACPDAKFHVQGAGHTVLFHPDKIELALFLSANFITSKQEFQKMRG